MGVRVSMTTRHGMLARMFLRSCAVLMRLYGRKDAGWLWAYATLSVSLTVMSVAFLVMFIAAVLLRNELPTSFNPLTAQTGVLLAELAVVGFSAAWWVDFHLREFKHDASAASQYTSGRDRAKWWLELLFSSSCILGMWILIVLFK